MLALAAGTRKELGQISSVMIHHIIHDTTQYDIISF